MNTTTKKPLTQAERDYLNKYLNGNLKKQQKREQKYTAVVDRRNACLESLAPLDRLPGAEKAKALLADRIAQVNLLAINPDDVKKVMSELEKIEKDIRKVVATQMKAPLAKAQVAKQAETLNKTLAFPPARAEGYEKEVSRGVLKGGAGPKFKKVTAAMKDAEKDPSEKHLAALERAAREYLDGFDTDDQDNDEITKRKAEICENALLDAAAQRKYGQRLSEIKPPPWNSEEETNVRALQTTMLLERKAAKKLGAGESGASESFFIAGKEGSNQFIFKPSDGENVSGFGWKQGGGAPREVAVSSLNETMKESGLDCGVSRTSLVKVDSPSVATDRNANQSQRVGAVQDFVPSLQMKNEQKGGKPTRAVTYADVFNPLPDQEVQFAIPEKDAQKILVLDFVSLQLDRNDGNMLIQEGPDGQPRAVPIDAGNALPNRDAWNSRRRTFGNQALLQREQANEPFDPEILAGIESLDPKKIGDGLRQAKKEMASVDGQVAANLEDESIEMAERSAMFLKKAAPLLKTPKALAEAYGFCLHKVFDAKPGNIELAIDEAIRETQERLRLKKELEQLQYEQVLAELAWPYDIEFGSEDPAYLLEIVKARRPNPIAQQEVDQWVQKAGGLEAVRRRFSDWDTMTLGAQRKKVSAEGAFNMAAYDEHLLSEDGDRVLQEAGIDASQMTAKEKSAAMWQVIYKKMGGDVRFDELAGKEGLQKIPNPKKSAGNTPNCVLAFRHWDEYLRLGGSQRHVELGGTGAPGSGDPAILLRGLRELEATHQLRGKEVREALQAAAQLIEREDKVVQRLLSDAQTRFDEATAAGVKLLQALSQRNQGAINTAFEDIEARRDQISQLVQQAATEALRIEKAFYQDLPTADLCQRLGQAEGRKNVIQNGIDRVVNDLTGDRRPIQNYVRWLKPYDDMQQSAIRGVIDRTAAIRATIANEFRKLAIQEFPAIQGADSRVGTLLDGTEERLRKAKGGGASSQDVIEIIGRLDQIGRELPLLDGQLKSLELKVGQAQSLCTQEVRAAAAQQNGKGQVNENLARQVSDLDGFTQTIKDFKQGLESHSQKLKKFTDLHGELVKLAMPKAPPTPDKGTPRTPPDTPRPVERQDSDTDVPAPAEPLLLDISAPNPWLYFQPNSSGGVNYAVDSGDPGTPFQKVEQFCAYLAAYWLQNSGGQGGLKFADLGDKQAAIQVLADWGASGGLSAQTSYAEQALGGVKLPMATVTDDARSGRHPAGTRIWFGSDVHVEAAFVTAQMDYTVYDPNTGASSSMKKEAFANYAGKANVFVVA